MEKRGPEREANHLLVQITRKGRVTKLLTVGRREDVHALPILHVPNPHSLVVGARERGASVRRELHAANPIRVPRKGTEEPMLVYLPHFYRLIVRTCQQLPSELH